MLPARQPTLPAALRALDELRSSDGDLLLRAELVDGAFVHGRLITIGDGHLSLELPSGEMGYVPIDRILSLEVGGRRAFREFLLVAPMILGIVAALVAVESVPFLRAHLPLIWVVTPLVLAGWVGIVHLRRKTRVGGWLTEWRPLFEDGRE